MAEMQPILILSTGHVSETTAKMLESTPVKDWPVSGGHYGEYGWFMYAGETGPEDLQTIFEFARQNHCQYVLLDRDGAVVEELPVYDW